MKQVGQNYKSGAVVLEEVPAPKCRGGGLLVTTEFSAVSIGTEGMKVREGKMSYVGMARARPDQVKKVLGTLQQHGLKATYQKVMNRLDSLTPLGYSTAGRVDAIGSGVTGFKVGQRVACGGAGYANHAEVNFVPKNLCVAIPDEVSGEHAAFATIGSIAMQAYRQSDLQLGEVVCVIGLGLIGQILVQILVAAGTTVIGVDLDAKRLEVARQGGAVDAFKPDDPELRAAALRATGGHGMDCVFITAGGSSNHPIELASEIARDRARIVDVGKTKLNLSWNEFYEKELDLRFSRSYGPGRYDSAYEEEGFDYPLGYVRWTENRNMQSFLELVAKKAIDMDLIVGPPVDFERAEEVYETLAAKSDALGLVFRHEARTDTNCHANIITWPDLGAFRKKASASGNVAVGVIGAGNYASSMLLPHLAHDKRVELKLVATSSSLSAKNAAQKFGIEGSTSDHRRVMEADEISTVLIATRHSSHVELVCEALSSGKNVYVEKPLAIDREGLDRVVKTIEETGNDRLMVGFNRRFAPAIKKMKALRKGGPTTMLYRVQAGALDHGSWYLDPKEGGRFVGEAGHFFDLMTHVIGSRPVRVSAHCLSPQKPIGDDNENVIASVEYADGSIGCLMYLTQGCDKVGKEYLELHGCGQSITINNFESVLAFDGAKRTKEKAIAKDKGQKLQMQEFVTSVATAQALPIPIEDILDTTALTLAAAESIRVNARVSLADYLRDDSL